jgi:hypothetical protein
MENIFNSLGQKVYDINNHKGYLVKWNLISPLCKKWSRNRDCDMIRIDEMFNYYINGGYIPRIIHLAEINCEGLICYDGNHRREVFNKCLDQDILCVIDVMFNAKQNDVYEAFANINKSVQLPAIYLVDQVQIEFNIKDDILQLVKTYETNFKSYLSSSSRCHIPHFNRDSFVDNIYNIYKSLNGSATISDISKLLDKLNVEYSKGNLCRPHSMYKPHIIEKCKKNNLWLFIERTIPFEHVYKLLKSN